MDDSGMSKGPGQGRSNSSPSPATFICSKAQAAQTSQRPKVKITPFHSSPIVHSGTLPSKQPGAVSGKLPAAPVRLFLDKPGHLIALPIRERLDAVAAASGSSKNQTPISCSEPDKTGEKAQESAPAKPVSRKSPKASLTHSLKSGPPSNIDHGHSQTDKNKVKPQSAVKKKKRKMGMYNLAPKKKAKALKQHQKKIEPGSPEKKIQTAAGEKAVVLPDTVKAGMKTSIRNQSQIDTQSQTLPREGSHVEYTELALDCLDLKAQEELFSSLESGVVVDAEVTENDLAEELPLCCCRMETPHSGSSFSTLDQTCMAMESVDGILIRCQRGVMKQEMMRPSITVPLLVLCEDHRAGMVKHQCCPGCGLFCRVGTFMECRPYGSICHRFHHNCASIWKDRKFCPHCGEDCSGANEVTVLKTDPSPSAPRSDFVVSFPVVPTVATPSVPNIPAVPQILRAKKTSEPNRSRDESPRRVKGESVCAADRLQKESLESILTALDDDNLKPKRVKYPTRQLYISAKQGDLQKVINLLVDGKDPNFLMEGQNKRTPLHAAAAEGHQEICHMLVQEPHSPVGERRMLVKLTSIMDNTSHPLYQTVKALCSPFSGRLRHSQCRKERYPKSFIPNAVETFRHLSRYRLQSERQTEEATLQSERHPIQAGANLDMFDEEQRTPLMAACENNHLETVKYLFRAGADINHKDIMGFTCLHLAAKLGYYDIVSHLISKASKYINCQDDGGWTPITWAIENKHKELVLLLLARGANVNIRDKEENVCLHWAAVSGCDDVAYALLEAQCDLSAANIHGDTPLHIAARENHLECVMLFLSRGADVAQRNREGETALDCCIYGSKVWIALNTNTKLTDARRGRDCYGERVLSRDISRGYEAIPVPCINGVDSEPCPQNFKYIPDNCVTSPLNMDKDITHLQNCSCKDDCSSTTCMCGQLSLRCWYDSEGRLPLDFFQQEPPVLFECNQACSCWRTCRNRVVQNGLRVRLQLFRTQQMGWGLRAMQDIPQGSFVCEYVGEIITDAEADNRENDSFLFTLDNKVQVGDIHCIDARLFGNIGRFINHLCDPNLVVVRVFTMHQDLRFPRIAFFSSRFIKSGDQIGFDYGDHYWKVKSKYFSCQCGSVNCRHSALM